MVDLDRRAFFKHGLKQITETAVQYVDKKTTAKATQWIRPPYAINELEFILACNQCGDCIDACQYKVVFPLPANYGISVVKTPALDLNNKGCHLCTDMPCVTACDTGALKLPELPELSESTANDNEKINTIAFEKMATATIITEECLPFKGPECGACAASCTIEGALRWNGIKPVINNDFCVGCGMCREVCIANPKAIAIRHF